LLLQGNIDHISKTIVHKRRDLDTINMVLLLFCYFALMPMVSLLLLILRP
jgi:hypothetical protein